MAGSERIVQERAGAMQVCGSIETREDPMSAITVYQGPCITKLTPVAHESSLRNALPDSLNF
jgi:hypothetical protein